MHYNPLNHHRRSVRLQGRNYAQAGMYYVTILMHERECLLGEIVDGKMRLSEIGEITRKCWMEIPKHFPNVSLDEFRVMPNHLHGVLILNKVRTRHAVSLQRTEQQSNEQDKGILSNEQDKGILSNEQGKGVQLNEQGKGVQLNEQGKGLINQTPTTIQTPATVQIPTDWALMKNPCITLGKIVRHFKAKTSKGNHQAGHHDFSWHRNFHDHIICNPQDLNRIRRYIQENPINWPLDDDNPENRK